MQASSDNTARVTNRRSARRVWSAPYRVLVSLLIALIFHGVYAGWHWRVQFRSGAGLVYVSPSGEVWRKTATRTIVTNWLQETSRSRLAAVPVLRNVWQSNLSYTVPTLLPASLIGVVAFVIITRWYGPPYLRDPYCRCRRCGYILAKLEKPRCPECGEAV